MLYEYVCPEGHVTERNFPISKTRKSIKCKCGLKAEKNLSAQVGKPVSSTYYPANFFALRVQQRAGAWHVPSDTPTRSPGITQALAKKAKEKQ